MSSSQNKGIHVNDSTPTNKDLPEGKTTAAIAVIGVNPMMVTSIATVTSTISKI
jgi:hypothetical protein